MNPRVLDVMSTIPTTFNESFPSYTVVGGRERAGATGLSAVLLNREGRFSRRRLFHELEKTGFDTVISVEPAPARYDIEELATRFPFVRFILLKDEISFGEQINIAASETDTPLFFVLWNDIKIIVGGTARRMAERLTCTNDKTDEGGGNNFFKRLCTVPVIQNSRFETIPTIKVPTWCQNKIATLFFNPKNEGLPSLYPFDWIGIYDRDRFIRLGGFDSTLKHKNWQLMDFGFRAWLWGEEISSTKTMKLSYDAGVPAEDHSVNTDYYRFYLKNLAPVFKGDFAHLPLRRFPGYALKACGSRGTDNILSAWEDFSESRRWVKKNQYRWRYSPDTVTDCWNYDINENNYIAENGG